MLNRLKPKVLRTKESQGRGQGKPQVNVFKKLAAVSCENELKMAKFEERGLQSSKFLEMNRETVKVRRARLRKRMVSPLLTAVLQTNTFWNQFAG